MSGRRNRDLPLLLLLSAAFAAGTLLHGVLASREARAYLDGLLRELGGTIVETAAAGLRSSVEVLDELEREMGDALRLKAGVLSAPSEIGSRQDMPLLSRFALAAGLSHVLIFDAGGGLVSAARDVPPPGSAGSLDPDGLRLALEDEARALAREARDDLVVREIAVPGAG
ncbi:MAG: hypothetical protein ACREID_05010, partial [Planctomycetota bacterium]